MSGLDSLSGSDMLSAGSTLSNLNPHTVGNSESIELEWAIKASNHAETYFSIITSVDPTLLKLTAIDDQLYTEFRMCFPDFKVDVINLDEIKSKDAKEKWRSFCEYYKGKVEDYNFGTMLRLDSSKEYAEENTELVVRIQFLAIEIARNREGHNAKIYRQYQTEKKGKS